MENTGKEREGIERGNKQKRKERLENRQGNKGEKEKR